MKSFTQFFFVMLGLVGSTALAQNLTVPQVSEIRKELTSSLEMTDLDKILKTKLFVSPGTVSSSFYFKQLLSVQAKEFLFNSKYKPLLALDPSLEIAEYEAQLEKQKLGLCFQALNGKNLSIEQLITDVFFNFLDRVRETKDNEKLDADKIAIRNIIRAHLAKAPKNSKGETLEAILGPLYEGAIRKNRVRAFRFEKDDVTLSLSSLISLRTREDHAFVELQSCLVDYLKQQNALFDTRYSKILKGEIKVPQSELFKSANLGSTALLPLQWSQLQDPSKIEAARLQFFMEGVLPIASLDAERDYLFKRMSKIQATLPFFESRLKTAKKVNGLSRRLSLAQADFLIDALLQLNRDSLPSGEGKELSMPNKSSGKSLSSEEIENYFFQRQTHRDILSLVANMSEVKKAKEAKAADLMELRRKQ